MLKIKPRHASLRVKTEDGCIVMVCSSCGAHYENDLNTSVFKSIQETGCCLSCGAILDGEEKNEE